MIEVLSHNYNSGQMNIEDDVSLNSAQSGATLHSDPLMEGAEGVEGKRKGVNEITDELEEEEDLDELRASPLLEKLQSNNGPQAKGISFMDYIRKKRNALIVLNNSIEGLSSSLDGSGSLLFGFANNYSDMENGPNNTDVLSISSAGMILIWLLYFRYLS